MLKSHSQNAHQLANVLSLNADNCGRFKMKWPFFISILDLIKLTKTFVIFDQGPDFKKRVFSYLDIFYGIKIIIFR